MFFETVIKNTNISSAAKLLYVLYAQRQECSIHYAQQGNHTYIDNHGAFIYFDNATAAAYLNVSKRQISRFRNELVKEKLIKINMNGSRDYKIYVTMPKESTPSTKIDSAVIQDDKYVTLPTTDMSPKYISSDSLNISNESYVTEDTINTVPVEEFNNLSKQHNMQTPNTDFDFKHMAFESLLNKATQTLGSKTVIQIERLSNSDYTKAKLIIDTIYKAKAQVTKRLLASSSWKNYQAATQFEVNYLLKQGLSTALLNIAETLYNNPQSINNFERFLYAFIRNYIASSIRDYIYKEYELTDSQIVDLAEITDFSNGKLKEKFLTKITAITGKIFGTQKQDETPAKKTNKQQIQRKTRIIVQKESLPTWMKPGYQEQNTPNDPDKSKKIKELLAKINNKKTPVAADNLATN